MTLDEAAQPGRPRPADGDDTFGVSAQRVEDRVVLEMTGELDISGTELALSAARSALEAQPLPTTLQNWQSEFLAVGTLVVVSVFLRQQGSPESKPVHAPHHQTGAD